MLGYLLLQLTVYFSKLLHLYPAQIDKYLHSSDEYMFRQNLYTNSFYLPLFKFMIRYMFLQYLTTNDDHPSPIIHLPLPATLNQLDNSENLPSSLSNLPKWCPQTAKLKILHPNA